MKIDLNETIKALATFKNEETKASDLRREACFIISQISTQMLDDEDWGCYQLWKAINEISDVIWTRNRELIGH